MSCRVLLSLVLLLSLFSCRDKLSLDDFGGESRLVVYAFPTESDSLDVVVSVSQSVNGCVTKPNQLQVRCWVNGCEVAAGCVRNTVVDGFPVFVYRAYAHFQRGDAIRVVAEAQQMPHVYASTTIPFPTVCRMVNTDTIFYQGDYYAQIRVTLMSDDSEQHYAARMVATQSTDDNNDAKREAYVELETAMEPLLNQYTEANLGFDAWSDYYHYMYSFSNATFIGHSATIRLCSPLRPWHRALRAQMFVLSEEYAMMLRSLNDNANNDLGRYGISMLISSYSNVHDGYGCVAGYEESAVAE